MTKAEEAAMRAYPKYWAKAVLFDGQTVEFEAGEDKRMVFTQGYEQAEEDFLDRLAKFYAELDYTFRSYLLQDFPELIDKVKDIE